MRRTGGARQRGVPTLIARYFGDADGRHRRDRHGGSVAGERDDLREAVHDSGQVDRERRRQPGIRDDTFDIVRQQGQPAGEPADVYVGPDDPSRITRATTPYANARHRARRSRPTTATKISRASTTRGTAGDTGGERLPRQHRELQHIDHGTGATRSIQEPGNMAGPTIAGHRRSDREGSQRVLGQRLTSA